jgi:predicted nucleic acid-binding protein
MTIALDSWAVLRLLEGHEPAASKVQGLLDERQPVMSWINLGEVFYVVSRDQGEAEGEQVLRDLRPLLRLDLPTEQRVLEAARLKAEYPMAYADAFAAATALAHDATLWTGDPELLLQEARWRYEDLRDATTFELTQRGENGIGQQEVQQRE